jgi:hypothetical protein
MGAEELPMTTPLTAEERLRAAREMITAHAAQMDHALRAFVCIGRSDDVWRSKLESELKRAQEWLAQPDETTCDSAPAAAGVSRTEPSANPSEGSGPAAVGAVWCIEAGYEGSFCPFTKRVYMMHIDHPELGRVPTYGGPFDSYTVPTPDEDGHLRCERYDHDVGDWVEGGEPTGLLVIAERHAPETPARQPDGYAYRYPSIFGGTEIRMGTTGNQVNGRYPIEAIPYYFGTPEKTGRSTEGTCTCPPGYDPAGCKAETCPRAIAARGAPSS